MVFRARLLALLACGAPVESIAHFMSEFPVTATARDHMCDVIRTAGCQAALCDVIRMPGSTICDYKDSSYKDSDVMKASVS
jgi:hypothetical protein